MLFHVTMKVSLPRDLGDAKVERLKKEEKKLARELQESGRWRHLWRVVGAYENVSIFAVENAQELHSILTSLPLFPFMEIEVTALCQHPSAIAEVD